MSEADFSKKLQGEINPELDRMRADDEAFMRLLAQMPEPTEDQRLAIAEANKPSWQLALRDLLATTSLQAGRWTGAVWYTFNLSRLRRTHIVLNELNDASPSGSEAAAPKGRSLAFIALSCLAIVLLVLLGVYQTIPAKQHETIATPPSDPIAQAIHDLQTSQRQAVDQLKALQETASSDRAEVKQLSGEVSALNAKLDALQQSFASTQQQPSAAVQPIEPARPKRWSR
jgi:hypothetical protein